MYYLSLIGREMTLTDRQLYV